MGLDPNVEISLCGKDGAWYTIDAPSRTCINEIIDALCKLLPPLAPEAGWAVFDNAGDPASSFLRGPRDYALRSNDDSRSVFLLLSTSTRDEVLQAAHTVRLKKSLDSAYGPLPLSSISPPTIEYDVDGPVLVSPKGDHHVPVSPQGHRSSKLLKQLDEDADGENSDDGRIQTPFPSDLLSLYSELCEARSTSKIGRWKSNTIINGLNHVGFSHAEIISLCHDMSTCLNMLRVCVFLHAGYPAKLLTFKLASYLKEQVLLLTPRIVRYDVDAEVTLEQAKASSANEHDSISPSVDTATFIFGASLQSFVELWKIHPSVVTEILHLAGTPDVCALHLAHCAGESPSAADQPARVAPLTYLSDPPTSDSDGTSSLPSLISWSSDSLPSGPIPTVGGFSPLECVSGPLIRLLGERCLPLLPFCYPQVAPRSPSTVPSPIAHLRCLDAFYSPLLSLPSPLLLLSP